MKQSKLLTVAITFSLLSIVLIGCTGQAPPATPAPEPTPTPSIVDAGKLYTVNCAMCHGESRYGMYGRGGSLTPQSLAERSDSAIKQTILEGIPYTDMPQWKGTLSAEEIDALVQFIKYASP